MDLSENLTSSNCIDFSSIDYSNDKYDPESINISKDIELKSKDTDIILSVHWKNGMLGAASYSRQQSEILVLYDAVESNLDYKILSTLFMQIKPKLIVVCNLVNRTFLKAVKQLANNNKINMYTNTIPTISSTSDEKVHILPKQCFNFKTCEKIILSMPLSSAPKNKESRNRYIYTLVDFTQELAVCALGALLHLMDTSNLQTNFSIFSLRILNVDDLLWLDISTYESLQIFSAHEHPSANKWIVNSNKDLTKNISLSVFSLLNRCNSVFGSEYLKNILARPTKNIDVLRYRHEVIEFCLKPYNKNTILSIINCIKHCRCVLSIVVKLNGGNASMNQWKLLHQAVLNAIKIGEICGQYSKGINLFKKINESLKDSLYTMASSITCLIDFEKSIEQDKFVVNTGVLPELDEKKLKIENISHVLDVMTLLELKDLPSHIWECSICKWPELGFFLCIPISSEMTENNDYTIQNLEYKFQLTDYVYYKTSRCYELDKFFGEIESGIIREETQTMIKLTELITQHWISDLHDILNLIAELDCLIGFADVTKDLKLVKPKLLPKEKCIINIVNGRHILQEQYVNTFIPNSYNSSKKNQIIQILTGFNSTGKSIYLKQVALISYLCHIGCYVPAEYMEISVLDHIHTRIQSTESVSTLMSAFMVDLKQMSLAVNESTCGSLIILDEFGKGTSEFNGLALLLASINHFVHRPLHLLPHVIVSTHFYFLPNLLQQIINKNILFHNIKFLNMDYKIVNNEIVCLYMVVDKIIDQNMSMAHHVAALNGLPTTIVQRATQVLQSIRDNKCINPMIENLRFKLILRRKQYIENLLELILIDGITESTFKDLVDDLENVRYPQK